MTSWFDAGRIPLYLAPMAGVTDTVFRGLCKEWGADVMVTEFVSAEGILQADARTRHYTEFTDEQRAVGVQLFGADGKRMAEAAKKIIDWKCPDFIDINFGCPVNKVVAKNGGSALMRDCPLLTRVAGDILRGVGGQVPVTAKMRTGWDSVSLNAVEVARSLEGEGIAAIAVHGRTRAQGYSGVADWDVIDAVAAAVSVPVIGNGDIASAADAKMRRDTTRVRGLMIGRAAMSGPWIFQQTHEYLRTGVEPEAISVECRWEFVLRHTRLVLARAVRGSEENEIKSMRSRLMHYTKGMPGGKWLRGRLSLVKSYMELETVAGMAMEGQLEELVGT